MADLRSNFLGIKSPNPFWLASAPPTDRRVNVERAFRAGWGGVVWKTLGEAGPPVVNVSGPRYGAMHGPDRRLLALNNIELITDRDLEINLQEIKEVKRKWHDRAVIVSLMVPCEEDAWKKILTRVEETDCDGIELNFGCPHGMKRARHGLGGGPGARICRDGRALVQSQHQHAGDREADAEHHRHPRPRPRGEEWRSRRRVAHQHNQFHHGDRPRRDDAGRHDRRQGHTRWHVWTGSEADRALHGLGDRARRHDAWLPISAIGGITTWRDAAEFIALGAGTVRYALPP